MSKNAIRPTLASCSYCGSQILHQAKDGQPEQYACSACHLKYPANDFKLATEALWKTILMVGALIAITIAPFDLAIGATHTRPKEVSPYEKINLQDIYNQALLGTRPKLDR